MMPMRLAFDSTVGAVARTHDFSVFDRIAQFHASSLFRRVIVFAATFWMSFGPFPSQLSHALRMFQDPFSVNFIGLFWITFLPIPYMHIPAFSIPSIVGP